MKKLFLVVFAVFFCFINKADASTLEREYIDNVWSFHYREGKVHTYGQLNIKHIDGSIAYCIQPDRRIDGLYYTATDNWSVSTYNDDVKNKMQLYAYYGYQYPGHNNIKYYMAAQELIWLFSNDEVIRWTKENYSASEEIDISKEKNEILSLVSKHNVLPSFSSNSISAVANRNYELVDTNNVLSSYDNDYNLTYKNNSTSVSVKNEKITINFKKKSILSDKTLVYLPDDNSSQRIAVFGNPNLPEVKVNIVPETVAVTIHKKDLYTKKDIKSEDNILRITNVDTNEIVGEYNFVNGKETIYLKPGKYMIEEIKASFGYAVNKTCTFFETTLFDKSNLINFYNIPVTGKIRIKKTDEDGNYLVGTVFNIYDENNEIVDIITTTKNEYDESEELELGNYTIKEEKSLYGYKIDNKVYNAKLEYVDQNTPIIYKNIESINEKIKCNFTFIGTDEESNKLNIKYQIYDEKDNLIYEGTEEKIELPYGKYYLTEKDVPNGYKLNNEKVFFEVSDKACGSCIRISNKKVNMPITSTTIDIISILLLMINCGIYKIYKKYN